LADTVFDHYQLKDDGYCKHCAPSTAASNSAQQQQQQPAYRLPGGLYVAQQYYEQLFGYQRQGLRWYWSLHLKGEGGILGDDMGLGKTIQTLTFMRCLFDSKLVSRVLIVMPVAVMVHWKSEIERWCPGTRVAMFHGSNKKAREKELAKIWNKGGICLTSYGLITTSVSVLSDNGNSVWDYIILDEGHKIKVCVR
jgi:DNA excision repair protein ERCC-6-like